MKLYWCPRTRSSRVLWMLEELELEYERVLLDIRSEQAKPQEFLDASPLAKVPALVDGEVQLAESGAICLYLADRYSRGKLAPEADAPTRGRFLYWMFYTPAVVEPALAEKFAGTEPNRGQNGWGDFESMIAAWEMALVGREWLIEDRFSAADVMVGSSAVFMKLFNMLPDSQVLTNYAERCLARPAYKKVLALDE